MLALLELISLLCLRSLWPSFFFFVVELEIPTLIGLLTLLSFFFFKSWVRGFFFPIHVLLYTRNTDWQHPARASEQIMKDVHSQEEDLSSLFVALNLFSFWKQKISFLARLWESLANQFLWWNNCVCCLIVFSFTICIASAAAFSLSSPCRFFLTLSLFSYLVFQSCLMIFISSLSESWTVLTTVLYWLLLCLLIFIFIFDWVLGILQLWDMYWNCNLI